MGGQGRGREGERDREGKRENVICLAEYKNYYENATDIAFHLINPVKRVQPASKLVLGLESVSSF